MSPHFLGCSNWLPNEGHMYIAVPSKLNIDHLEKLIRGDETAVVDEVADGCGIVHSTGTHREHCLLIHKGADGKYKRSVLKRQPCPVKIYNITPLNPDCPYVMVLSVGVHNHPPPPPTKVPTNIRAHCGIPQDPPRPRTAAEKIAHLQTPAGLVRCHGRYFSRRVSSIS
ncbi:hypothetical protein DFS34DRAFT_14181 [Phlyctochytrium arcticum]|nr:hypothetical protein DFS34DRAFT_14181 [Phlyctochytrium arcticum]